MLALLRALLRKAFTDVFQRGSLVLPAGLIGCIAMLLLDHSTSASLQSIRKALGDSMAYTFPWAIAASLAGRE
jgi:uncharacterized membrane protein